MTENRLPRLRDPVQLGKMIGDILTDRVEDPRPDVTSKFWEMTDIWRQYWPAEAA
jgi:hypothetical protein